MDNLSTYKQVQTVPPEAQKTIGAGRLKGFTDINPMWRIKKLTEIYGVVGFGWYYEIVNKWTEKGGNDTVSCFVEINLYVKSGEEWSKPIQGLGGSMFVAKESSGLYTSDECYKMALTDAISVSCKSLGMGADVYFSKDRTKYDNLPEPTGENKEPKKTETKEPNKPKELMCSACCGKISQQFFDLSSKKYGFPLCSTECVKKSQEPDFIPKWTIKK